MKRTVIIAAGGLGNRMGSDVPKQFIPLNGKAIIIRSIEKFVETFSDIEIIVVINSTHLEHWNALAYSGSVIVVEGGEERFHSIQNAVEKASGDLIAIHDAVRPFVSTEVITKAFEQAEVSGAVIPVIPVKESLRKITFDESEVAPRGGLRFVQTPQVFKANIIKMAYEQKYHLYFTDDATVVENAGHDIVLIDGNEENIKITTPFDLKIANAILNQ